MKLQLCIYLMVLATVARSMNLPGDLLAVNEETFVAVDGDAAVDSQSKGADLSVDDSDMSDLGRLHLELDLLNAENAADMADVAQEVSQDSENEDRLHLELDLLNAEQAVDEATVAQEQEPESDNKLHLELDLLNGESAVEGEALDQEVVEAQNPENEDKLHLELDLLDEELTTAAQDDGSGFVTEVPEDESKLHLELDLLSEDQNESKGTTSTNEATESEVTEGNDADETNESPLNEEKAWFRPATCTEEGLTAAADNCHKYTNCSDHDGSGQLTQVAMECGADEAFHAAWNGCRRDLGKCTDNVVLCTVDGSFSDPDGSNTSYYLCQKSLSDSTYHLFHVHCKTGEVFLPALGKCFIDMTNFASAYQSYDWVSVSDYEVVKKELDEYRMAEKMELKLKKEEAKMLKKLQKELEKLAKKKAKEEAKAQKEAALLA